MWISGNRIIRPGKQQQEYNILCCRRSMRQPVNLSIVTNILCYANTAFTEVRVMTRRLTCCDLISERFQSWLMLHKSQCQCLGCHNIPFLPIMLLRDLCTTGWSLCGTGWDLIKLDQLCYRCCQSCIRTASPKLLDYNGLTAISSQHLLSQPYQILSLSMH